MINKNQQWDLVSYYLGENSSAFVTHKMKTREVLKPLQISTSQNSETEGHKVLQ